MLILLPPSEGKTAPRRGRPLDLSTLSSSGLSATRNRLVQALVQTSSRDDAAAVLGLTAGQAEHLVRNRDLLHAPTARADAVYTGVLFDALSPATLSSAAKRRAHSRLGITSALFGLLRPADRIPAYRLSGDATLPDIGTVAGAWRAGDVFGTAVRTAVKDGLLVDLRSSTYAAFWRPEADLAARLATVRVLTERDGARSVVSHFNKATKGRLVRALLEDGRAPRRPAALAAVWRDLGWQVETHDQGARGTRLDVIVTEV